MHTLKYTKTVILTDAELVDYNTLIGRGYYTPEQAIDLIKTPKRKVFVPSFEQLSQVTEAHP